MTESDEVEHFLSYKLNIPTAQFKKIDEETAKDYMYNLYFKDYEDKKNMATSSLFNAIAPHKKKGKGETVFSFDELLSMISGIEKNEIKASQNLLQTLEGVEKQKNKKEVKQKNGNKRNS